MNKKQEFWTCVVGPADQNKLPKGCDLPMRMAVQAAFANMTGEYPDICSSGWGSDSKTAAEASVKKSFVYAVEKANTSEPELRKLTSGELLSLLTNFAKDYVPTAVGSVIRNNHMNDLPEKAKVSQKVVDAVVVDFINFIGNRYCVDYGLYTKDLNEPKRSMDDLV
jgi:hypothetical protein